MTQQEECIPVRNKKGYASMLQSLNIMNNSDDLHLDNVAI